MMPPTYVGLFSQRHLEIDGLMVDLGFDGRFGLFGVAWPSALVDRRSLQWLMAVVVAAVFDGGGRCGVRSWRSLRWLIGSRFGWVGWLLGVFLGRRPSAIY